jgi:hypothetical protein
MISILQPQLLRFCPEEPGKQIGGGRPALVGEALDAGSEAVPVDVAPVGHHLQRSDEIERG